MTAALVVDGVPQTDPLTVTTDARGRYQLPAASSPVVVRLTAGGYLPCLRRVIPVPGGGPAEAKVEMDEELGKEGVVVYPAYHEGNLVGEAYSVISHQGFSGDIEILLGVSPEGRVTGVEIITHAETPGLGAKIVADASWKGKAELVGRSLSDSLAVKKDGGEIDTIAGATISPRAVCGAVKAGLEAYNQALKGKLPATPPAAAPPTTTAAAAQGAHS